TSPAFLTGSDHGCSCGASCQCPAGQCKCPVCFTCIFFRSNGGISEFSKLTSLTPQEIN
ncbi:hypothetical protein BP00DRAFT_401554, partial [Aspergillus indologenus CBS 114.80]